MSKKLLLIILTLFMLGHVVAQNNEKNWADGQLIWDDFKKRETTINTSELNKERKFISVSELIYYIGYNISKYKFKDSTILRFQATCFMDRNLSWISKEFRNDQYLKYNQVIFNIAELHKRKLQYDLDRLYSYFDAETRFDHNFTKLKKQVDQFRNESEKGQDSEVIEQWDIAIQYDLQRYGNVPLPELTKRNFGYGMHVGIGTGLFTGSAGKHFGPTFNFIYGFDLAYKKSILFLNATLAGGNVKKEYFFEKTWSRGASTLLAIVDVSYGYAVIDNSKFKLSPFAGLGITEISGAEKDKNDGVEDKDRAIRLVDYNYIFGLNADYKIRKRINLVPEKSFGIKESVETSIRGRLYITRSNFFSDLNGYSVNLTIGICGFGTFLKVKYN